MNHSINQDFNTRSLLMFACPSIIMMIFMSLYTIVDGIFISRYVGSNALSSTNIVFPVINIVLSISCMLATGGTAIISQLLGHDNNKKAKECFSLFVVVGLIFIVLIMIITLLNLTSICYALGSNDLLLADCKTYLKVSIYFAPITMLQVFYQSYFVADGRPHLGLFFTIFAGILNFSLDYLLVARFSMGVFGAALATCLGQAVPAVFGTLYFLSKKSTLHYIGFHLYYKEIFQACYNGSSEMVGQLSNAVITVMFNLILMKLTGESGVAAITILLYAQFLFNAFYMGFSIGVGPIFGFQYGAKNRKQLMNVYRISILFVVVSSLLITGISIFFGDALIHIFTNDPETFALASKAFWLFALNFLFSGINIVTSGIFTALSNGKISAIVSFSRTLVFTVASLLTLPHILGLNGVWLAVPVAEFVTALMSVYMHIKYFKKQ